ncbi:MAG: hypothetical protein ACOYNI_06810 [Acidimicrobiia bacterium]
MLRRLTLPAMLAATMLATVSGAPASAASWKYLTLDGGGTVPGHVNTSVGPQSATASVNGVQHVIYQNRTTPSGVRHAYKTNSGWQIETIDGLGGEDPATTGRQMGEYPSAVTLGSVLHAFYWDGSTRSLRHAYLIGSNWYLEYIDGIQAGYLGRTTNNVGSGSSAVVFNNQVHVFYSDNATRSVRHAWYDGTTWSYEWLDGPVSVTPGRTLKNSGRTTAAGVDSAGCLLAVYDTYSSGLQAIGVRVAKRCGNTWTFKNVDGANSNVAGRTTDPVGGSVAVAAYNNETHVFAHNTAKGDLRHMRFAGGAWTAENLDGPSSTYPGRTTQTVGYRGVSTTVAGTALRVYYASVPISGSTLRQAMLSNGTWSFRMLDGVNGSSGSGFTDAGSYATATTEGGRPVVYYSAYQGHSYLRRAELS